MAGQTSWNGGLPDEDFQQFFDLSSMGNHTTDDMQHFGFADLLRQTSAAQDMDTPMTGTATNSAHTVVASASSAAASLAELDAKIEDLRRMRREAQLRQIEEQSATFFASPHPNQNPYMMPPTPQSLELQPGTQLYTTNNQHMQQQQQQQQQHAQMSMRHQQQQQQQRQHQFFERYQQANDQPDLLFTPLVSPAVTPLDTQFDTQFNSAFFTPLTSPALQVQVESTSALFDSSTTTNPELDLNMFYLPDAAPSPNVTAMDGNKKARKTATGGRTRKTNNVRPSPITKPQRKKSTTTPIISAKTLGELAESLGKEEAKQAQSQSQAQQQQQQQQQLLMSETTGESENGSVSPVNLTAMPPPPRPSTSSALPSPYLHAVSSDAGASTLAEGAGSIVPSNAPVVATPASLMRLSSSRQKRHKPSPALSASSRPSPNAGAAANVANEHIEDLELPESLTIDFLEPDSITVQQPAPAPTRTLAASSPSVLPATATATAPPPPPPPPLFSHARRATITSAPAALSTTTTFTEPMQMQRRGPPAGPAAAAVAPAPAQQQQQQQAVTRRTPQLLPRGVQISPALRPRISPNLKPLLPGHPLSAAEDQASRLLATKSNYQNILEGNTVPGVSYPSELSTSLTSKRTSHKLAEQGRRNRINAALAEMAAMLPPMVKDKGGSDNNNNSNDEEGDAKKGAGGKGTGDGPNSKADTVEQAIEYIRQLRREVAEATRRAEEAEAKLCAARAASADGANTGTEEKGMAEGAEGTGASVQTAGTTDCDVAEGGADGADGGGDDS